MSSERFTYHEGDTAVEAVEASSADDLLEKLELDDTTAEVQRRVLAGYHARVTIPEAIADELRGRFLLV